MFYINTPVMANNIHVSGQIHMAARRHILLYKMTPSDTPLNNLLKAKYKLDLKTCSLALLKHVKYSRDLDGRVIVTFKDTASENLAKLITYGNGMVLGSKILRIAFLAH